MKEENHLINKEFTTKVLEIKHSLIHSFRIQYVEVILYKEL